jgi:LuxR family transcriptional regulator, maltose regulon positive regulatory protein
MNQHSLEAAAAYITLAERHASEVLAERQHQFALMLAVVRLALARQRGDLESALHEVGRLLEHLEAGSVTELTLINDAKMVALMNLGIVELRSFRLDDAARHLEQSLALARLIDRPTSRLAASRILGLTPPDLTRAGPVRGGAGGLDRTEHSIRAQLEPAMHMHSVRAELHVGDGRLEDALSEFRAAERLQEVLATPHAPTGPARVSIAQTQLRMGDSTGALATVIGLTDRDHEFGEARTAFAALRLAEGDPRAEPLPRPSISGSSRSPVGGDRIGLTLLSSRLESCRCRNRLPSRPATRPPRLRSPTPWAGTGQSWRCPFACSPVVSPTRECTPACTAQAML